MVDEWTTSNTATIAFWQGAAKRLNIAAPGALFSPSDLDEALLDLCRPHPEMDDDRRPAIPMLTQFIVFADGHLLDLLMDYAEGRLDVDEAKAMNDLVVSFPGMATVVLELRKAAEAYEDKDFTKTVSDMIKHWDSALSEEENLARYRRSAQTADL